MNMEVCMYVCMHVYIQCVCVRVCVCMDVFRGRMEREESEEGIHTLPMV